MSLLGVAIIALATVATVYTKVSARIDELEQQLTEESDNNSNLSAAIKDLEESSEVLSKEKEFLQKKTDKLKDSIENEKKENKNLRNKYDDMKKKYEAEKIAKAERKKSVATSSSSSKPAPSGEWKSMRVNASAYTTEANGDKLGGGNITSTGTTPKVKHTIAVDPKVIPYGSLIKYNGVTYTAEDTGGMIKGNKVDFFMGSYEETVNFGRRDIDILVKTP